MDYQNIQLRCPNCSGAVTFGDKTCPWCGGVLEQTAEHVAEHENYIADYTKTTADAKTRTRLNAGIILAALLLGVFVAGIVINLYYDANMYTIRDRRAEAAAEADYDNITAVMDKYLEEEDYARFYAYCRYRHIEFYTNETFASYRAIGRTVSEYVYAVREIMNLVLEEQENGDHLELDDRAMAYISGGLTRFYRESDIETYKIGGKSVDDIDQEQLAKHAANMERDLRAIMHTYFGCTDAEFARFRELEEEDAAILLWEIWERRTGR